MVDDDGTVITEDVVTGTWPFNPGAPAGPSAREVELEEFIRSSLQFLPKHLKQRALELLGRKP